MYTLTDNKFTLFFYKFYIYIYIFTKQYRKRLYKKCYQEADNIIPISVKNNRSNLTLIQLSSECSHSLNAHIDATHVKSRKTDEILPTMEKMVE